MVIRSHPGGLHHGRDNPIDAPSRNCAAAAGESIAGPFMTGVIKLMICVK